jgi:hypothetical protein
MLLTHGCQEQVVTLRLSCFLQRKTAMPARKTWTDKLHSTAVPVVKPAPINIAGMKKGQVMLIPTPKLVAEAISRIPEGKSLDVLGLRKKLAAQFKAEVTCPITMGFHLRTVAEAAFEAINRAPEPHQKKPAITPFWRVLDMDSPTTQKLSFDPSLIAQRRAAEGLSVTLPGTKPATKKKVAPEPGVPKKPKAR